MPSVGEPPWYQGGSSQTSGSHGRTGKLGGISSCSFLLGRYSGPGPVWAEDPGAGTSRVMGAIVGGYEGGRSWSNRSAVKGLGGLTSSQVWIPPSLFSFS